MARPEPPQDHPDASLVLPRVAFAAGDALGAIDRLQREPAAGRTPAHHRLLAAALLRAGALEAARGVLQALQADGALDEQTLGLVAREAKARWLLGEEPALAQAQAAYERAFDQTGGTWTGINAATLALLQGDAPRSRALAARVRDRLQGDASRAGSAFWAEATLGEAALLLGEIEQARAHYRAARALAQGAWGDLGSVRRQARAVLAALGLPASALDDALPEPRVAVFSGHMLDAPGRPSPRLPAQDEPAVRAAIEALLDRGGFVAGMSAAACGSDIVFLEALQARGCATHIVLPHEPSVFRQVSVTSIAGEAWGARFDAVLARASEVTLVSDLPGEDLSYQFHGEVLAGLARLKARALDARVVGVAVWDGRPGGVGGTSSVVQEWARRGLDVEVLPWRGQAGWVLRHDAPAGGDLVDKARASGGQRVVGLLFADVVGFSKLGELQVKAFFEEFWGRVAALLKHEAAAPPLGANTWGDGLFLVYADPVHAARTALRLARMVAQTPWAAGGVAAPIGIRIALHAGPVYEVHDPITGRPGHAGIHISRAARIEPVTPPGQVYASEAFAALLALDDSRREFTCEYVGIVPLAKDYGRLRTYRLAARPAGSPNIVG